MIVEDYCSAAINRGYRGFLPTVAAMTISHSQGSVSKLGAASCSALSSRGSLSVE